MSPPFMYSIILIYLPYCTVWSPTAMGLNKAVNRAFQTSMNLRVQIFFLEKNGGHNIRRRKMAVNLTYFIVQLIIIVIPHRSKISKNKIIAMNKKQKQIKTKTKAPTTAATAAAIRIRSLWTSSVSTINRLVAISLF